MMSILQNETPFNSCNHSFFQRNEWLEYEKTGDFFVSTRRRWSECRKCHKQNVLIPKERQTYGIRVFHSNIKDLLNEDELPVAVNLLSELIKGNNNKRWVLLRKKLLQSYPFVLLDSTMEKLHLNGILIFKEEKVTLAWKIKQIKYHEKYVDDIYKFIGKTTLDIPIWMSNPFLSLSPPKTLHGEKLYKILLEQKKFLTQDSEAIIIDELGNQIVSSSARKGYYKFIKILYGLYENAEQHRKEYWKIFSQRVFGDTKVIQLNDKKRIQQLFGTKLEEFGIISERSEVVLSGECTWKYEGHSASSLAFKDYIAFPRDMINEMKLISWMSSSMLIIENPDLYFSIIKSKLLLNKKWSILLGSGFVSSQEVSLVYQACDLGLKEIFIWPDLDPYGLLIAQDICRKLKGQEVSIYLFGFTEEFFEQVGIYKPLEPYDIDAINKLLNQGGLQDKISKVLKKMKAEGKKAEQEILFSKLAKKDFCKCLLTESISLY